MPVFMISDAPWIAYKEAYKEYEKLPLLANKFAKQEAEVARKITGVIYPTVWACKEAKSRFSLSSDKIHLLPFGANRFCTKTDEQVFRNIQGKSLAILNFLFIGKDWDRKGGPLAIAIVNRINEGGHHAILHIIGCDPEIDSTSQKNVKLYGYLSPESTIDCAVMEKAFLEADFFLVPSYAECFGLVFAEAQSYGLPCLSLNSHGIPGVVENGKTGILFDLLTHVDDIVSAIIKLSSNPEAYMDMAFAARMKFRNDLNWDAFGVKLDKILSQHLMS
jgi:glycosyltransferase involved in cell wall biosynthesis